MIRGARRLSVLLTIERAYPYHTGAISNWCHRLTSALSDVEFTILALAAHPQAPRAYRLTPNVRRLIVVPLGDHDDSAYGPSTSAFFRTRWHTTGDIIAQRFVPAYDRLLREAMSSPPSLAAAADAIVALHDYFNRFDYLRTMTDRRAWSSFAETARSGWELARPRQPAPSFGELAEGWRLVARLLRALTIAVPQTDVTHAAAAAVGRLPCLVAKLQWGVPFVLTEHVVAAPQQSHVDAQPDAPFVRWLLSRVVGLIGDLSYIYADRVTTGADDGHGVLQAFGGDTFGEEYRAAYHRVGGERTHHTTGQLRTAVVTPFAARRAKPGTAASPAVD